MRADSFLLASLTLALACACSKSRDASPGARASARLAASNAPSPANAASGSAAPVAPASAPVPPAALPGNVSPSASYLVSLETDGCPLELRINDVPVREVDAGQPRSVGEVVDPWLKSGVNTASLVARGNVRRACASLDIRAVAEDGDQRTAPRVLEVRWPPSDRGAGQQVFEFHGPAAERCRLWGDVEPVELDATARSELLAEVRTLHRLFTTRKVASLAERADYRAKDIARCFRKSPASGVDDQQRFFGTVTDQPPFTALDETALSMDVVGRGRIVWVHRRDARLVLENGVGGGLDLYFGKVDGRFTLVR